MENVILKSIKITNLIAGDRDRRGRYVGIEELNLTLKKHISNLREGKNSFEQSKKYYLLQF